MKLFVKITARNRVVALTVEPSNTVEDVLEKFLGIENMEKRPDELQRLMLGDTLLENFLILKDLGIEDEATLEFVDPGM
jgi:hypothetical protein